MGFMLSLSNQLFRRFQNRVNLIYKIRQAGLDFDIRFNAVIGLRRGRIISDERKVHFDLRIGQS